MNRINIIRFVCEGRFGMGIIDVDVEGVGENEDVLLIEDVEKVVEEGGFVCSSGDDGLEYVVGEVGMELDEMWLRLKDYFSKEYGEVMLLEEWYELMKKNKGKLVDLY